MKRALLIALGILAIVVSSPLWLPYAVYVWLKGSDDE